MLEGHEGGLTVDLRRDESTAQLIKRFIRKCKSERIVEEHVDATKQHVPKAERRRLKKKRAEIRRRRREKTMKRRRRHNFRVGLNSYRRSPSSGE